MANQSKSTHNQSDRQSTKPPAQRPHPLSVIHACRSAGINSVAVAVSCGKDSVATLDLCCRHFARVEAYFMFFVRGLSFQERYLNYLESRYQVSIARIPHPVLSRLYRGSALRHGTKRSAAAKIIRQGQVEAYVRHRFNVPFIATGERRGDSIERNTQIVQSDGGISFKRRRIWPIGYWTTGHVESYLALRNVILPPDYRITAKASERRAGASFGNLLRAEELLPIRDHYPADFELICRQFPLARAQIQRAEQAQKRKIS